MDITKTSILYFVVVILTISFSNHNVSAVTGMKQPLPHAFFLCNGFPLNDFACHHDCGSKGYNHGRCGGNPSRCCCLPN
ncbi:hypothetical protein N665_0373s0037 [Sinapis alba]|nr:hypothetical protein N665_0373s0037 [Sinapis alba]